MRTALWKRSLLCQSLTKKVGPSAKDECPLTERLLSQRVARRADPVCALGTSLDKSPNID
jgi:hypothetical protein